MRITLLTLSSSSSIVIPLNSPHHSFTTKSLPSSSLSANLSHSKTSPTRPLLSTVRWDLTFSRHQDRLKYYADLASKLAEDGKFDDFLMIAESIVVSGVKPSQFATLLSVELVSKGIIGMLENGEVRRVAELLSSAQKLGFSPCELFDGATGDVFRRKCPEIAKNGEVDELVDLIEILSGSGCQFSIKELVDPAEIIRICVTKQQLDVAIRYTRNFPNAHMLFCSIILEFGKKGDLVSALNIFEASKQDMDRPNMYIYRTIIDVCGLCGDYLMSRSIYEDLLTQKITPNLYVFNSLMNVNSCDLSYTLQIHKHMQNLGVAADMTSYNILLKSCCRASRVDLAQNIYREVRHMETTGVLKLDVFTYSTIIKAFADTKMWQMALEIKEDMLAAGVTPNTITWSSLINACASAGLVEQAILLFEEMLLAGCKPNTQCCNTVLHACVEACQYDRAFRLFRIWKGSASKKFYSNSYQSKIDVGRDNSDKTTTVRNTGSDTDSVHFNIRVPFKPTTATYNILMKACGTDYQRAKAMMHEMKALGLAPNHISWSIMIEIFGRSRNVDGAVQILNSMREAGIQPDVVAYTATMKVCVQNQQLKYAFSLFEEMKRYKIRPNLVTYNTLLRARTRYGSLEEVQQCLAIYQEMRRAGYSSNDYYLKQLIEEWCEGVIQGDIQNQGQSSSSSRTDIGGPQSLLLEKVAANLQKTGADSLVVDLQGLTKVEARILVLAVLRMIKENYTRGISVKDDMIMLLGVQEIDASASKRITGVEDAILKLLRDELNLEVILAESKSASDVKISSGNPSTSYLNVERTIGNELPARLDSLTRRPACLQRLYVTRNSLCNWLQKRLAASKRISSI